MPTQDEWGVASETETSNINESDEWGIKREGREDSDWIGRTLGATALGLGGAWGGAATGAAIGTALFPGVGTAIGGALGAFAGSVLGSGAGGALGEIAEDVIEGDTPDDVGEAALESAIAGAVGAGAAGVLTKGISTAGKIFLKNRVKSRGVAKAIQKARKGLEDKEYKRIIDDLADSNPSDDAIIGAIENAVKTTGKAESAVGAKALPGAAIQAEKAGGLLTGAGGGAAQAAKAGLLGEQAETKWNEDRWWNKLGFAEGGEVSEAEGWAAESAKYAKANKDVANISASDLLDFVPVVGDIKGAYEVVQEMQKEDPNWALIGALAGATIIGVVPGIGDAAAAAIKQGAKAGLKGVKGGIELAKRIEVDPNAVGSLGGNIRLKPVGDVKIGDPVPDDIGKREFTPTTPSQSLVQTQSNIPPRASGHTETRETSGLLAGPDVWRDRLYGEPTPNPNVPPPSQFSKPIVEKKTGSQYRDPNIDRFMAPADATRSGIAPRTSEPTGLLGRPPVRKQDTTFTKAPTNKPDEMLASVEPMITDIMKKNKSIIKDYDDSLQAARTACLLYTSPSPRDS